jgi:DNA polymerase epsilon subunit 3
MRIVKAALPENVQINKEAKLAFCRAAKVFILYITAAANDSCKGAKRQTISAADVMQALEDVELDEFREPLTKCLDQYRLAAQQKKTGRALDLPGVGGGGDE